MIPFNVLNYILGMSDVPVGCYVIASFLGMLPGTWLYVYLGSLATTAVGLTHAWRASTTTAAWPASGLGAYDRPRRAPAPAVSWRDCVEPDAQT